MRGSCSEGQYERDGQCFPSIHINPEHRGRYPPAPGYSTFDGSPREYRERIITENIRKYGQAEVDGEMSAVNSFEYRNPKYHAPAEYDLKFATSLKGKDSDQDPPSSDPPTPSQREQNIRWDDENYVFDLQHGNKSGAEWAKQRLEHNGVDAAEIENLRISGDTMTGTYVNEKGHRYHFLISGESAEEGEKNGGKRMKARQATGPRDCLADEEWVSPHASSYNGRPIDVVGYCRRKGEQLTAKDERDLSAAGRRNGKKAKGSHYSAAAERKIMRLAKRGLNADGTPLKPGDKYYKQYGNKAAR